MYKKLMLCICVFDVKHGSICMNGIIYIQQICKSQADPKSTKFKDDHVIGL